MSGPPQVAFVSLGCAKNLVDSEKMLGQLAEAGFMLTPDESEADVIVVNTCGFLEASRSEAHEVLAEAVERKQTGRCRRVVVAGCLVQRDGQALMEAVPGIDALVGVHNRDDVVRAVAPTSSAPRQKADLYLGEYHPHTLIETARMRLTPQHYAYMRISEGCDQKCTFCTIPSIRGPMHSKSVDQLVAEAAELVGDGAVELNLIGQDTTSYGDDIGETSGLAGLLRRLNDVPGARWIRLMYVYPSVLTDEMIDTIAACERVTNYIDIPLQHINDRVLKAMYRRVTRAETEALLQRIRDRIPGVAIRTTLIAGFPGETEAEHNELVRFIRDFQFDALGVFPYSLEPETPAGRMKGQIADNLKEQRVEELMLAQQDVAFAASAKRVGQTFEVLIDGEEVAGLVEARSQGQAPQVDSVTLVEGTDAAPGEFITVRCTAAQDYDLIAQPVNHRLPVLG